MTSPVDEVLARRRQSRATLERLLAPEVIQALDDLAREIAEELVEALRAELAWDGGKPWLTAEEAGELLSCSPRAIRARCKRGRLEYRYQGRRLYVSARSIQELG